jgi:hypothetical protein
MYCLNMLKRAQLLLFTCLVCLAPGDGRAQDTKADDVSVTKIWDKARHNAFTDLVHWNGRFYCTFREGERHVHGADGNVRVIASEDGRKWESVALFAQEGVDLRDPKLSITPDDRLMVLMGGSYYENKMLVRRLPRVSILAPGQSTATKSVPIVVDSKVASENDWLWRVTWHNGIGYGTLYQAYYPPGAKRGYRTTDERPWGFHLVPTTDGVHYKAAKTFDLGTAGEATPLLLKDDRMLIIARNGTTADLGISAPPYEDWVWKKLDLQLGGPNLILLPDGTIVLGTRAFFEGPDGGARHTVFGTLTLDGEFTPRVRVPSGGDTSYPGMILHDGMLWTSYYSSHEGRAAIYLAKIPLSRLQYGLPRR